MAAMFTRNKYIGWCGRARHGHRPQRLTSRRRASVVFSLQSWLGEGEDARKGSSTPGYFSVLMSGTVPGPPLSRPGADEGIAVWLQSWPSGSRTCRCSCRSRWRRAGPAPKRRRRLPLRSDDDDDDVAEAAWEGRRGGHRTWHVTRARGGGGGSGAARRSAMRRVLQ